MSKTENVPKKKSAWRVLRGGSWGGSCGNFPQHAWIAYYFIDTPDNRSWNLGVRLVEVIDEQD